MPPADISDVWMVDATMFLTTDPRLSHTGGAVTEDDIAAAPQLTTTLSSPVSGTDLITTNAARDWTVQGYVETGHGRVTTTVTQHMRYQNTDKIWDSGDDQQLTQDDVGYNDVTTGGLSKRSSWQYPISMDSSYVPDTTGSGYLLQGQVSQARFTQTATGFGDALHTTAQISDQVQADGVLQVSDTGSTLQADGKDSEDYQSSGPAQPCYHHVITADHGQVTSNSYPGCWGG